MRRRELGPIEHCMWHGDKVSRLNFTTIARVRGHITSEHLRLALDHLQQRHPLLEARLVAPSPWSTPALVFDAPRELSFDEHDLDEQATLDLTEQRLRTWIDPSEAPLMRVDWVRHTNEHSDNEDDLSTLLLTFHHIIGDGISGTLAVRDLTEALAKLVRGEQLEVPEKLPVRESIERCVPKEVRRRGLWRRFFGHLRRIVGWIIKHGKPVELRLDRKRVPIIERQICMARRQLVPDETRALVKAARENETTVHGALAAAILHATAEDRGKTSPLLFASPVDVRERVEPKVGDDIGMYVALGVTLHKVEPERVDFWALARDARDQLFSQVEDGGVHSLLPIQGGFLALAARLLPAKWFGAFVETAQLPGVGLTNIGRVVFDTDLSPLSIEHLSFGVSTGVLGKIGVTATTFDGTLTLNFMAMEPCITREHLNALADDVMDKLLAQL